MQNELGCEGHHCRPRAALGATPDMLQNQLGHVGAPPIKSDLNLVVVIYTEPLGSEARQVRATFLLKLH